MVGGEMVSWWRDGLLVARWLLASWLLASWLVARFPGGEVTGNRFINRCYEN